MALTLAAAALGSALLGGAASIYSASQQKDAAAQARDAQLAAQQQARGDALNAQGTVTSLQSPYLTGGGNAYSALLNQYGLNTPQGSGGGSPAPAGPASYNNYLSANPDLAAEAQRVTSDGEFPSVQAYLQWHDQNYGSEGRASTPDAQAPAATGAPGNVYSGPVGPPTNFGPQPTMPSYSSVPGAADISASAFQASPLYDLGLKEGQANLNENFGARGLLRSGAAIQGAIDFARQNVNNNYTAFANTALQNNQQAQYGATQNNAGQLNQYTAATNQYNNNRNFNYGQYTDTTNNLFKLAGTGIDAANNIGNAATNVAATTGNLALQGGQSQADYANSVGSANSQLAGSLAGTAQNLFTNLGSRTQSLTPVQTVDPYGYGSNQFERVNPYNPGPLTQPKIPVF